MSRMALYSCIMVFAVFVSSISQMMLKKSSQKKYPSRIREYLNPLVITAYAMFFSCTLMSMYSLKVVPMLFSPMLDASGYIFVSIFSYVFFKEKFTKRQIIGMSLILIGIFIGAFANLG